MSEELNEIVVDIPAEVVSESEEVKQPTLSEKEMRKFQRDRVTQINKILKNIRRREKNPIMMVKKMDNK